MRFLLVIALAIPACSSIEERQMKAINELLKAKSGKEAVDVPPILLEPSSL